MKRLVVSTLHAGVLAWRLERPGLGVVAKVSAVVCPDLPVTLREYSVVIWVLPCVHDMQTVGMQPT